LRMKSMSILNGLLSVHDKSILFNFHKFLNQIPQTHSPCFFLVECHAIREKNARYFKFSSSSFSFHPNDPPLPSKYHSIHNPH